MHLSHIYENLEAWYVNTGHDDRVKTMFRPGLDVPVGTLTVPQGPAEVSTPAEVRRGYRVHGVIGHSGALQTASRLARRHVGPDGTVYAAGVAIPQRADFNTLDNPFFWSADGAVSAGAAAGVHFVVFNPTSDDFNRVRHAMDGVLPDGTTLAVPAPGRGPGLQQHPQDDPPPELPRPASRSPLVPAFRDPGLTAPPHPSSRGTIRRTAEVAELVDAPDSKSGA